jgi:phosphate transport system substrate-binding protein
MFRLSRLMFGLVFLSLIVVLSACATKSAIDIDGSSTVFPITEAVAEEFQKKYPDVSVTVGLSGTGGGFKRFCAGEIPVTNASRKIKDSEIEACKKGSVPFISLPAAYDGLSVVVHKNNTFVDFLTTQELHAIFKEGSTVKTWKDVRPGWPAETMKIFSPGADSGTFDYFTEAINKKSKSFRNDALVTLSEDDNTLVQGVSGEQYAIGYFGYSYYEENKDKLKLVPVDNGNGPILPSTDTVHDGTYAPLSRPLFIYVNTDMLKKKEVRSFIEFYLDNTNRLSKDVGYFDLPQKIIDDARASLPAS